ncbi:hypothetical protein [Streptomyces sp. NBRC 110465]|uniref:hypothetical protein n=1 Tax=Streptomyces sp. NBRC 110465 TaxID=1897621 RepID=UPI0009A0B6CF|nr:hypothetical protein [Streptomyces sp. NBRC 110465]
MITPSPAQRPTSASARRPLGAAGQAAAGLLGAYSLLWAAVCFPLLEAQFATYDVTCPQVHAVILMLSCVMFWAYIGLGVGLSCTGWAAGLALTTILIVMSYASLTAQSSGSGFAYWRFLILVGCSLLAFCIIPNGLARIAVGRS